MKKRILSIIISAALIMIFLGSAAKTYASTSTLISNFRVTWTEGSTCFRALATWEDASGHSFEMAMTGLHKKISDDKLKEAAEGFMAGETIDLVDEGLTDAEKQSIYIATFYGGSDGWVVEDDFRKMFEWGDSAQCWAGSASDMLETTGWGRLATNPETGQPFASEDELFSYFRKCFHDRGLFAESGIRWFFYGKVEDEEELCQRDGVTGIAFFPDAVFSDQVSILKMEEEDDTIKKASAMLEEIKDGSSVGLSIGMSRVQYPKKGDSPDNRVIEYNDGRYFIEEEILYSMDELEEHFFTLDASGKVIILTQTPEGFKDGDGNNYPDFYVRRGNLYNDTAVSGEYLVPVPLGSAFGDVTRRTYINEDEVDLANGEIEPFTYIAGGAHAITATGYIKDVTADKIVGIMFANSDNDAGLYVPDNDYLHPENRVNSYRICHATVEEIAGKEVFIMEEYAERQRASVCILRSLKPAPTPGPTPGPTPDPVPATADSANASIFALLALAALALLTGTAVVLLRRKAQ